MSLDFDANSCRMQPIASFHSRFAVLLEHRVLEVVEEGVLAARVAAIQGVAAIATNAGASWKQLLVCDWAPGPNKNVVL